jgi:hypothetical protein
MAERRNYEVGYGKPPVKSRFQPGRSGNPSGRRKGVRSLKSDLEEELGQTVRVTENGKALELTKQQLVVKALVTKAAKGDVNAISKALDLIRTLFAMEPEATDFGPPLSPEEEEVLAGFLARLGPPKDGTS